MIEQHLNACKARVEACLVAQLNQLPRSEVQLADAVAYSLKVGGKRLRPSLGLFGRRQLARGSNALSPQSYPLGFSGSGHRIYPHLLVSA